MKLLDVLGPQYKRIRPRFQLGCTETTQEPREVPLPPVLVFEVDETGPSLADSDRVAPGCLLGTWQGLPIVSPVAAEKVTTERIQRGSAGSPSVLVRLEGLTNDTAEQAHDFDNEDPMHVFEELALVCRATDPRPLTAALKPGGRKPGALIINAVDPEPGFCARAYTLARADLASCASLFKQACGAESISLAVTPHIKSTVMEQVASAGMELLEVVPEFPNSLDKIMAMRSGRPGTAVVDLITAVQATECIENRSAITRTLINVATDFGSPAMLASVVPGTPFMHVLHELGIEVPDEGRIVAGGMLTGRAIADLSLGAPQWLEAICAVGSSHSRTYRGDPCINCGSCIDTCPVNLQPQLVGRYMEAGDLLEAFALSPESCVGCGLCTYVCPAARPLLQWMQRAASEKRKFLDSSEKEGE